MQHKFKIKLVKARIKINGKSEYMRLNHTVNFADAETKINQISAKLASRFNTNIKNIDITTKTKPVIKIKRWEQ